MFKQWCAQQKFNTATNLSHALMDGGVLSVPSDRLTDFYTKCVECIRAGEPIFVVEQKTPIYNFFVDIDYKADHALSVDTVKMLAKVMCDKVRTFGGRECLVSIAKPKPAGTKTKSGIHLNWPGFPVNQENAMALRGHLISLLSKVHSSTDWEQAVDEAVYKGSGFRMPWSHKKTRHTPCKGQGCEGCTEGRLVESPYLPVFLYRDGTIEPCDYTEPCIETLFTATVRSDATESVNIVPPAAPVTVLERETAKEDIHDSELNARLQAFVRTNLKGQGACSILKVTKLKNHVACSTDSRFCERVGREHESNHVWFSISNGRISQRCFDDDCKKFSSRECILSPSILKLLYPDRNVTSIVSASLNGGGGPGAKKSRSSGRT